MYKLFYFICFIGISEILTAQEKQISNVKITYEGYIAYEKIKPENISEAYVLVGDSMAACWEDYKTSYDPIVNDSVTQLRSNDIYAHLVNKSYTTKKSTFGSHSFFLKPKYNFYSDTIYPFN